MVLVLLAQPVLAAGAESVLMRIYLNHQDMGDQFFVLDGGVPLLPLSTLRDFGLLDVPESSRRSFGETGYASLGALQPWLSYRVEPEEPALHITIDPGRLQVQSFEARSIGPPAGLTFRESPSAYLDYALDYTRRFTNGEGTLSAPLAVTAYASGLSARSSFLYTDSPNATRSLRLMTSVVRDDQDSVTRLTLGDFSAGSGLDGGGGLFAGVSYSRSFQIDPYFERYAQLVVNGVAESPSEVAYSLGDRLLFSQTVSPGRFQIRNLRPPIGARDARLVIRDVFGNETIISNRVYFAPRLLQPGVHEFSYNIGFRRENFGQESNDYGELAALGFHRVGVTNLLTLGARAEADGDLVNVGVETNFAIRRIGEVAVRWSGSRRKGIDGFASSLDYRYVAPRFSLNLALRKISRRYANLNLDTETDRTDFEWRSAVTIGTNGLGNWTASYSARKFHGGRRITRGSLFFSRRIGRATSVVLRYTQLGGDFNGQEFYLGFTRPLSGRHYAAVDYSHTDESESLSALLAKNRALGPGVSYFARAGLGAGAQDLDLGLEYAGNAAVFFGSYLRDEGQDIGRVSTRGALALIDGGLHLSRPIADSFTLAKVGDLAGVNVRLNNQPMGRTNSDGVILIPQLAPYFGNRISFDEGDIPINFELPETAQITATPFRGGGITHFDVRRVQGLSGFLVIGVGEDATPAQYWGLRYRLGVDLRETVIGKDGEFYLENLPAGTLSAQAFRGDESCEFSFEVPVSDEPLIDLGTIHCENTN